MTVEEKLKHCESSMKKLELVKKLIERNRELCLTKKISFPFCIIEPKDKYGSTFNVKMQNDQRKLMIASSMKMKLHGDLETLSEFNLS